MLKKIGLRNIKSGISVFLCLILFPGESFFACFASIICLQNTISQSLKEGLNRIIGTIIGASIGLLFLLNFKLINNFIKSEFILKLLIYLLISLGIILIIYLCNTFDKSYLISIICVVFLSITTMSPNENPIIYSYNRTVETSFGILISIIVNKTINPAGKKL